MSGTEGFPQEQLLQREVKYPLMPDSNGCLSTAVSYGVGVLDGRVVSPEDLDTASGRFSGELPSMDAIIALQLWILDQGYQLENVYTPNLIDMEKYFKEGSKLTYEDHKKEMAEIYGASAVEWFDTGYREKDYLEDMANRREKSKLFDIATADGTYKVTKATIDVRLAREMMTEGVVIPRLVNQDGSYHAVVLHDIIEEDGALYVGIFNPGTTKSKIDYFKCQEIGDLFELADGTMVIRPPQKTA